MAMILAILLAPQAKADPMTFQGGIFDGLRAERLSDGSMQFLPGVVEARLPPMAQRAAIERFLGLVEREADLNGVPVGTLSPESRGLESDFRRIISECVGDEPYGITDSAVRIGWSCDNQLAWFSIFNFSEDLITRVRLTRALPPRVVDTQETK